LADGRSAPNCSELKSSDWWWKQKKLGLDLDDVQAAVAAHWRELGGGFEYRATMNRLISDPHPAVVVTQDFNHEHD